MHHPLTTRRTNLPAALTSFIGRTHELADVEQSYRDPAFGDTDGSRRRGQNTSGNRGRHPVGAGHDAAPLPMVSGSWNWRICHGQRLVAQALVRCFKLPEQGGQAPLELLQEFLADKHLLLILDNCEHLVEACADIVEHLVAPLLAPACTRDQS